MTPTHDDTQRELLASSLSPLYFVPNHVQILAPSGAWIPFRLWPDQRLALDALWNSRRTLILKARQLGMTWLALAYSLWLILFCPAATILFYSIRETESRDLLRRLHAMHAHLPPYFHLRWFNLGSMELTASNGSRVIALSGRAGRSYTARFLLVDEADYILNLNSLLNAAKPTIDHGGQLALISTPDRRRPLSVFKTLYKAAQSSDTGYNRVFLPWNAHPNRDAAWHKRTLLEMRAQKGRDDDFLAEYPVTAEEALSPLTDDKRLPTSWVQRAFSYRPACAERGSPLGPSGRALPNLHALQVFRLPQPKTDYLIAADPAEGAEQSDESCAHVFTALPPHIHLATYADRCDPTHFASVIAQLSRYYNHASVIPERNNHGHALILALGYHNVHILKGPDDKPGWLTTAQAKTLMYDLVSDAFRSDEVTLHDEETAAQLASIELATLSAPAGCHDDRAVAAALAIAQARLRPPSIASTTIPPAPDPWDVNPRPF